MEDTTMASGNTQEMEASLCTAKVSSSKIPQWGISTPRLWVVQRLLSYVDILYCKERTIRRVFI